MDQNQTVDNDLQKAIDDITNKTNVDPVFSDPVAAPSSIPEGDTGELDESVGPFPEPPKINIMPPAPEPTAPVEPTLPVPGLAPTSPANPTPEPTPAPEPTRPTTEPMPEPPVANTPSVPTVEMPEPEPIPQSINTIEIKKAALRDLIPLLDKINIDAVQRFDLYRDIFNDLKDYTVLEPAYRAAKDIPDETERAEALLYLVKSIDQM